MSQVVANEGCLLLLQAMIGGAAQITHGKLHLINSSWNPSRSDTYADLHGVEMDSTEFPGYAPQSAAGLWGTPVTINNVTTVARDTPNIFTPTGAPPSTVNCWGVFWTDDANTKLIMVDMFDDPVPVSRVVDIITYTIALGDYSQFPTP